MKKNQSISKSNKEASSSSKSNIVKKNLKREGKQHRQSPSLHCPKNIGLYVATFAKFLSDQINMPQDGFLLEYLCNSYATLLWRYGIDKVNDGYVSENDDSPKLMGQSTPPLKEDLVHIEYIIYEKFHDPFVMTKANIEKLKKDVPLSLKAEVVKTPQKEGSKFCSCNFSTIFYFNMF
ncbi:hypothetical protein H5410_064623 [Solanum commersonii]|uniref:Uncharacterized protein n=1 Tax=Solanum commersonii TaxID=4109 RepID=A0A9J5VYV7_SOLCO|nr:hypothetical protein H5410_064623 [Solanum commersonii]